MAEEKTKLRKYTAALVAGGVIAATVYGYLTGTLVDVDEGVLIGLGTLSGFAAKFLWDNNTE